MPVPAREYVCAVAVLHNEDETGNPLEQAAGLGRVNFGAELRRCRHSAGLSLAELAQRVHYSKGHLSKIENGRARVHIDLARLCDDAVGAGGELVTAAAQSPGFGLLAGGSGPEWVTGIGLDRAGGAAPWTGLRLSPPRGLAAAALEPALDGFRGMFEQARRLGQVTGPGTVLPMVITQARTVHALGAAAGSPVREALLRLAARYAEFVGWMAQEAGNDDVALGWTRSAAEIARAVGDRDLGAHAWVRGALVTLYREDAAQTVELAVRAQAAPGVSARIRGLAALREAQGHALGGEYDRCMRALDRGRELLAGAGRPGPDGLDPGTAAPAPAGGPALAGGSVLAGGSALACGSALGPTSAPDIGAAVTGWCLYDLGRPARAVEALGRELPQMPRTALRARARYGTRAALACLGAGDVDAACAMLESLLDEIEAVDSATVRLDLGRFARSRSEWRTHPLAGRIEPRLRELLRVQTG